MYYALLAAAQMSDKPFFYEKWIIIKQLIQLFGYFMGGIMKVLDKVGIYNIALCIVIFTIVTKIVLLPFTIKQQKSSRLTAYIQPELQAIQKKYRGKTDQASQQKMLAEQQAVQEKYGVSMTAGCLPLLLQMPILFALYPVIYRMDQYVPYLAVLKEKLTPDQLDKMYKLFTIDMNEAPGFRLTWAILIPILVALLQFASTKIMQSAQKSSEENSMARSMNTMNIIMPIMFGYFAISFPAFLGFYWLIQSLVAIIQQLIINKILKKKPIEELIQENIKKANSKREKKGLPPIGSQANMSTRNIETRKNPAESISAEEKEEKIRKATEYYQSRSAAPGSLAAKANMVRDYNEKNQK